MITFELMERLFPTKGLNPRKYNLVKYRLELIAAMNRILPLYGITTKKRICAFLANCGVETDFFRTTEEYASGADYEGRKALGNTEKGDGRRFKGRGLTQTTGRYNYGVLNKTVGKRLGIDFLKTPEKLNEIPIAVESACIFWEMHDLNDYADRLEFRELSGLVNRGDKNKLALGWEKRYNLYRKCGAVIPVNFNLKPVAPKVEQIPPVTSENYDDPARIQVITPDATPSELVKNTDDSFLAATFDKNVPQDAIKTALPSLGARVWRFLVRPLCLLYAALEAGNIAAWLGVTVAVGIVIFLIYLHRKDFSKLFEVLKSKFVS